MDRQAQNLNQFRRYCAYLPRIVSAPVFVKVGANDGVTGDPCSDILIGQRDWTGLLIEPVPYCFERLKTHFGDASRFSLAQVAIGSTEGMANFYYVDRAAIERIPDLPVWYDQLGSFRRQHVLNHFPSLPHDLIVECPVMVQRLSDVIRQHGFDAVHLLHIDTEGHDADVLMSLDDAGPWPVLILFEHVHVPRTALAEAITRLRDRGYTIRDCGRDYFAIQLQMLSSLQDAAGVSPP